MLSSILLFSARCPSQPRLLVYLQQRVGNGKPRCHYRTPAGRDHTQDEEVQCWHSISHQVLLLSACLSLLLLGVWLPTTMFLYSRQNIVYGCSRLHERYLCSREMEFVLGINEFYATSHIHLIASFRRPWAYYSVSVCALNSLCQTLKTDINFRRMRFSAHCFRVRISFYWDRTILIGASLRAVSSPYCFLLQDSSVSSHRNIDVAPPISSLSYLKRTTKPVQPNMSFSCRSVCIFN